MGRKGKLKRILTPAYFLRRLSSTVLSNVFNFHIRLLWWVCTTIGCWPILCISDVLCNISHSFVSFCIQLLVFLSLIFFLVTGTLTEHSSCSCTTGSTWKEIEEIFHLSLGSREAGRQTPHADVWGGPKYVSFSFFFFFTAKLYIRTLLNWF